VSIFQFSAYSANPLIPLWLNAYETSSWIYILRHIALSWFDVIFKG